MGDSQRLFPHRCAPYMRTGLARLVNLHLNDSLDRKHGHDSIRDAQAAMQLTLLKLAHGPQFANPRKLRIPIPLKQPARLLGAALPGVRGIVAKDLGNDGDVEEAFSSSPIEAVSVLVLRQARGGMDDINARMSRLIKNLPARTLVVAISAKQPSSCVLPFVWDDAAKEMLSASPISLSSAKRKKRKRVGEEPLAAQAVPGEGKRPKKKKKKND